MAEAQPKPVTAFEKYIANEPINDEMEDLARGQGESPAPVLEIVARGGLIDDDDRENLKQLIFDAGWPVVLKLWENELHGEREAVQKMSMADPLGNAAKVAQGWAYVSMLERSKKTLLARIAEEIKKIEASERGQER